MSDADSERGPFSRWLDQTVPIPRDWFIGMVLLLFVDVFHGVLPPTVRALLRLAALVLLVRSLVWGRP